MSKPADVAEAYRSSTPKGGGTSLDQIAGMTPIGGPGPSLDEQFGNGRNPFNRSASEVNKQQKQLHGGK